VTSGKKAGTSTGVTSDAFDSTGANLIVANTAADAGGTGLTVTDSKGNTYVGRTVYTALGHNKVQLWEAKNATVGSGHTITVAGTAIYSGLTYIAFSGSNTTSPFDQENGFDNNSTPATTLQPGSVTPGEANEVVVTGLSGDAAIATATIDGGFTVAQQFDAVGGASYANAIAYLIQTSIAAANPTWTIGGSAQPITGSIATYKAAAAGGAPTTAQITPALQRQLSDATMGRVDG
jgi:hypothetical protein